MGKLKFDGKQLLSSLTGNGITAYLAYNGVSPETAGQIGSTASAIIDSVHWEKSDSKPSFNDAMAQVVSKTLDSQQVPIADRDKLVSLLTPRKLVEFLCDPEKSEQLWDKLYILYQESSHVSFDPANIDHMINALEGNFKDTLYALYPELYFSYFVMGTRTAKIYTANQEYWDAFHSPMFLHGENSKVTLQNLYVMPKYRLYGEKDETSHDDLEKYLRDFIHVSKQKFLLIEGDAGCGKTTLTAWLNADGLSILGNDYSLVTVRLRDLDKDIISKEKNLIPAIFEYTQVKLQKLQHRFPNAVLFLDGFDELCMIDGLEGKHDFLLSKLNNPAFRNFKIIVTSRPNFVSSALGGWERIELLHFDPQKRNEWIQHYTLPEYCGEDLDPDIQEYIEAIDEDSVSNICDTPMTLYMLAAKEGSSKYLENSWALYHHIFYTALSETEYNIMVSEPDQSWDISHRIASLQDFLYAISEEIAYRMYRGQNKTLYLSRKELSEIITELKPRFPHIGEADLQKITEHSYGLCCYWKSHGTDGAVEFLHNNIRDFFLAEKIYREMEELYSDRSLSTDKIVEKLCLLLNSGLLENQALEFLYWHFQHNKVHGISDFAEKEHQKSFLPAIIKELNGNGILKNNVLSAQSPYSLLDQIKYLLINIVWIYRLMYEFHRKEGEYIPWSSYEKNVDLFSELFSNVFGEYLFLSNISISLTAYGNFQYCRINASLFYPNFYGANLNHSLFISSKLRFTDFQKANLQNATFQFANLQHAKFLGALFQNIDLRNAHLENAILPDGFTSPSQEAQLSHLRSMNIPGLILTDEDYFRILREKDSQ